MCSDFSGECHLMNVNLLNKNAKLPNEEIGLD